MIFLPVSFTQHSDFEIGRCCDYSVLLILLSHISSCERTTCLFIHLLMDIEILSTSVYKLLCGNQSKVNKNLFQGELVGCAKYILNFKSSQAVFLLNCVSRPPGAPHSLQCVAWSVFFTVTTGTAVCR